MSANKQAVQQVLSPNYEPTFHGSSHGFRPERSCHTAIAEAKRCLEEGYEWVVDLDLEKFRPSSSRAIARATGKASKGSPADRADSTDAEGKGGHA